MCPKALLCLKKGEWWHTTGHRLWRNTHCLAMTTFGHTHFLSMPIRPLQNISISFGELNPGNIRLASSLSVCAVSVIIVYDAKGSSGAGCKAGDPSVWIHEVNSEVHIKSVENLENVFSHMSNFPGAIFVNQDNTSFACSMFLPINT